jgi:hypothetical protein
MIFLGETHDSAACKALSLEVHAIEEIEEFLEQNLHSLI